MKAAMIYIFVGAVLSLIGVLVWNLWKKRPPTHVAALPAKLEVALNKELVAMEDKILVSVTADQKRKELADIKAIEDKKERLRRLAILAKSL